MRIISVVVVLLLASGCVSKPYMYDNISYSTSVEAHNALRADMEVGLSNVAVSDSAVGGRLEIVTPNVELLRRNGVIKQGNTPEIFVEYIVENLQINYGYMVKAVRKSQLFSVVNHTEVASTFNKSLSGFDAMLRLHSPAHGQFQWYLELPNSNKPIPINFDAGKSRHLQIADFVDRVRDAYSTNVSASNNKQSANDNVGSSPRIGSGTGFFINPQGDILTNSHVVEDCKAISITSGNGEESSALLISSDKKNDLAVLKATIIPKKYGTLYSGRDFAQGSKISVFGFPYSGALSSGGNYGEGIVSAVTGLGDDTRFYQISAPVQPGNSGGPALDEAGNVVGIVTSKLNALRVASATGDIPQNVNFAIKSPVAKIFLISLGIEFIETKTFKQKSSTSLASIGREISVKISCY